MVRWESASIGTYTSTDEGFVTETGDLVLFVVENTVLAVALADGSPRWRTRLPTRIERLCQPAGDTIIAIGIDGLGLRIQRRDGTVMLGVGMRSPDVPTCAPLLTDARERVPQDSSVSDEDGLLIHAVATGSSTRVLMGRSNRHFGRSRGSGIATLVATDLSGRARWRVELPEDQEAAPQSPPIAVAVGDHEVCAAYALKTTFRPIGIDCLAIADGRRMWSGWLDDWHVSTLKIEGRTLLISRTRVLEAFDLDSGARLWQFAASR